MGVVRYSFCTRESGCKVVSKWCDEASRHGLSKGEIDRMASAFEHEDLQLANGLK